MTKFIGFEVLIANALIHEMESSGRRHVTLDYAQKYAQQVSKNLYQDGVPHAILYDNNRFQDCEHDFIANVAEGVIVVNDGVSSENLRENYRGMLSYEVLKACVKAEEEFDADIKKTL